LLRNGKALGLTAATLLVLVVTSVLVVASSMLDVAFAQYPPAIYLDLKPQSQDIHAGGGSVTFNLTVLTVGVWGTGNVGFRVVNLPQGVTATFSPSQMTNITAKGSSSILIVNAAADASPGKTTLTILGEGAALPPRYNETYIVRLNRSVDAELNIIVPLVKISTVTATRTSTLTSTIAVTTTAITTVTEKVADSSTYVWAVSATVSMVVLAKVLLLQRSRTK
jgi:hypothetical protein